MLKHFRILLQFTTILLFQFAFNSNTNSQEIKDDVKAKISYSFTSDINSQYLWRGISGSTGYVVQPCMSAVYKDVNIYLWGNIEPGLNEGNKFNEIDASVGYSKDINNLTIEPSLLFYFYPGIESGTTSEFILKLSHPVYKELSVFTIQSIDIAKNKGSYFGEAGLSLEHWFNDKAGVNGTAGAGWGSGKFNETYNGISKGALNAAYLNASFTYYISKYFYSKPKVELQLILDNEIKEASGKSSLFNFGITLGTEF